MSNIFSLGSFYENTIKIIKNTTYGLFFYFELAHFLCNTMKHRQGQSQQNAAS